MTGRTEAELLTVLAVATRPSEVTEWLAVRWPPPLRHSVLRWERYKEHVQTLVEGESNDDSVSVNVGCCVRCGSRRLLVTTKQLQRAT